MKDENLTRLPEQDPAELFRYRDGICAVELLGAAIAGLDFFSWLAKTPSGKEGICSSLGLAERPVDVMLTLFLAMGLLERRDEVFHVTETAREFLVRGSPWFQGPYYASFPGRPVCRDLLQVLRSGKPVRWAGHSEHKPWAEEMEDGAFAQRFTEAMDCRGAYLGPALAQRLDLKNHRRLLDIAGGSGIYACCIAAAHPHMKATVLEKSPMDRIAQDFIAGRCFSGSVGVEVRDLFADPLPHGYDVHLFSHVLHDWDTQTVAALIEKSFAALPPGGMVVVHDAHINRDKTGPLPVAAYSVLLMASTEGRCYSISEIEGALGAAGFVEAAYRETAADRSVITAKKPGL